MVMNQECGRNLSILFMVGIVFAIVVFAVGSYEQIETKIEEKLVAFNDGQSIEGSVFVSHGTIKNVSYYVMYIKNSDGGIKQLRVIADCTIIYEEDRKDGLLEGCEIRNGFGYLQKNQSWYSIHVPKGTFIRQFKADLE